MKSEKLTPDTIRWLALGWMGLVLIGGICTFVGALVLFNGQNTGTSQASARTPRPTKPAVQQPQATLQPGITPTVWMPVDDGKFALGGQTFEYPIKYPDLMHNAGMSWVKYQLKWDPGSDPNMAKDYVTAAHQSGFKILLSIPGQPSPQTTIEYDKYVLYLKEVASSQPDAIEVWNEMNLDREWPVGQIDPASYVTNMLIPAHDAIKEVSPSTMVLIGALSPTGSDNGTNIWSDARYAQGLADAGAANYADCVGVHHNGGTTPPSATTGHVYDSGDHHYSWYFQPTIDIYHNAFPSLPICLTEFGYLTPEGYGELSTGFAWAKDTTVANQAAWLAEGVTMAKAAGYVRLVIIWNVDSTYWGPTEDKTGGDPQAGFAILRPDKTCPACTTLQAVMLGK
jgi:hypothetical protein